MARLPYDPDQLCDEIADEVCDRLPRTVSATPGMVGAAMISPDAIKAVVRTALDFAVQLAGPAIESGVITHEDQIKSIVSPAVLDFVDKLVHGLKGGVAG